jgi:hypothetical protein
MDLERPYVRCDGPLPIRKLALQVHASSCIRRKNIAERRDKLYERCEGQAEETIANLSKGLEKDYSLLYLLVNTTN